MGWLEDLRYMESNVENKEEKNVETENVSPVIEKKLDTRNDLLKEIESVDSSIDVIKDLKTLGLDITNAVYEATNKLKKLIDLGQKKQLLNDDEISTLNKKLQSLQSLNNRNPNEEVVIDKDVDSDER